MLLPTSVPSGVPLTAGLNQVPGQVIPPYQPTLVPAGIVNVPTADGGMEFHDGPEPAAPVDPRAVPHGENLADHLSANALTRIAAALIEGIDADRTSNDEMFETFKEGLKLLAQKPGIRIDKPFKGAAGIAHPLLTEAVIRTAANLRSELLPAAGPARTQTFGDQTPETEARAQHKANFLNWFLTEGDAEYYDDYDQMLIMLAFYGSMFRKVYPDPMRHLTPTSRSLSPYDLIVNYAAVSLHGSARVTQIERDVQRADLKRLQLSGWYKSDVHLGKPTVDDSDDTRPDREMDGRMPTDYDEDATYTLAHAHCLLDIEGMEHIGQDGEPTGLPLPYVVTLHEETRQVLRVAHNWNQADRDFNPVEYFVHYRLWPGFGFYGWGMVHLLGAATDALTVMLRQGINAFTLASFPGGFRVKGMRVESSETPIAPCEFRELDTGGMAIGDAIMALPYKDIPPSFQPLMEAILEAAQRLSSLNDVAVGDGREDALPGTVIALIEKATKLETTIAKRLHVAQRRELRMIADLFGKDPNQQYPYQINGKSGVAVSADFANNNDVVPVSDPNVPTQTERLVKAQAVMQLAAADPSLNKQAATENYLRVLGLSDADIAGLMPPPQQAQPADPVSEFAAAMKGAPLAVGPTQDHASHIAAHHVQLTTPGLAPPILSALAAHIGDHTAAYYTAQASAQIGHPIVPGQVPPQMQAQVAAAVAQASTALAASLARLAPPQPNGKPQDSPQVKMADIAQKEADSKRNLEATQGQQAVDMAKMQADSQNAAADRAARIREAELNVQAEQVKARGDVHTAMIDAAADHLKAGLEGAHTESVAGLKAASDQKIIGLKTQSAERVAGMRAKKTAAARK